MGNIILVILVFYILGATIGGFRKGFLKSLFMLATWFLTFAIAMELVKEVKEPLAAYYLKNAGTQLSDAVAYTLSFVLVMIILKIIFAVIGHFLHKVSDVPVIGSVNKLLGGVMGFVKGLVVVSVALLIIYIMPYIGMQETQDSLLKGSDMLKQLVDQNILINILKNLLTNPI